MQYICVNECWLFCYFSKFVYEEVYIDDPGNSEWNRKYRFDIPVIHVNGKLAMKHRVDKQLLEQIIHNAAA